MILEQYRKEYHTNIINQLLTIDAAGIPSSPFCN